MDINQLKLDLAADTLRKFGGLRLRVTGFSMLPTIWPGDVVSLSRLPWDQYRTGDLVLFTRQSRFFLHRLIQVGEETAVTRGDALPQEDPPVRPEDLLGRVVSIERRGSRIAIGRKLTLWQKLARAVLCGFGGLLPMVVRLRRLPFPGAPAGSQ